MRTQKTLITLGMILVFALSWVLNTPSTAIGFDTVRGIGDDIHSAISTPKPWPKRHR